MSKVTITRTLHVHAYACEPLSEHSLFVYTSQAMENNNYVSIGTVTIQLEIDPMSVTGAQIKQIQSQIADERANSQARLTALQGQINNLTCLEASHD